MYHELIFSINTLNIASSGVSGANDNFSLDNISVVFPFLSKYNDVSAINFFSLQ